MSNKLVMYDHTYINKSIEDSRDADFKASNLYFTAAIEDKASGDVIRVPYSSITQKYADILSQYVRIVGYTESQFKKYQYKPKLLSQDIYGTTELWASLLQLNGMVSVLEFNRPYLKVYDPNVTLDVLNELLIIEGRVDE